MTPQERELITGLFERMRGFGAPAKDSEAETSSTILYVPIPMHCTCLCKRR